MHLIFGKCLAIFLDVSKDSDAHIDRHSQFLHSMSKSAPLAVLALPELAVRVAQGRLECVCLKYHPLFKEKSLRREAA